MSRLYCWTGSFQTVTPQNRSPSGQNGDWPASLRIQHGAPKYRPIRGETFVTRKVSRAVARIVAGKQDNLYLGNLDAVRDWGHAKDYVEAIYLMLQQAEPRDYVIGTGEGHTVREFCRLAFDHVGLNWEQFVEVDPRYLRPTEVEVLVADPSRAQTELGWKPTVTFEELVRMMVESDLARERLSLPEARSRAGARLGSRDD